MITTLTFLLCTLHKVEVASIADVCIQQHVAWTDAQEHDFLWVVARLVCREAYSER
jgi:hypothetical protein